MKGRLLAALAVAAVVAACGESSEPAPAITKVPRMSLAEYASWCKAQRLEFDNAGILQMTFGEYAAFAEGRIDELGRTTPPEPLQGFHEVATSGWIKLKKLSDGQPSDKRLDPSLFLTPDTVRYVAEIQLAISKLPPEFQASIVEAGCFQS